MDLARFALESQAAPWRRRRAARRLVRARDPASAWQLAQVYEFSGDDTIVAITRQGLDEIADQSSIDLVCEQWNASRSPRMSELLVRHGWIAEQPLELRVLTALHLDQPEAIIGGGPSVAEALLRIAAEDVQPTLRARAGEALESLTDPAARETVCTAAIDANDKTAFRAAAAGGYEPREPVRRAILLFLQGKFDRYRELDFDGRILRAAYAVAPPPLRARLAAEARAEGRLEWVHAVGGGVDEDAVLTADEWETIRSVLAGARQWDEMWRLAKLAPAIQTAELVRSLHAEDWRPERGAERSFFRHLARVVDRCSKHPPVRTLRTGLSTGIAPVGFALSPDGRVAAVSGSAGDIELWRLPAGERAGRIRAGLREAAHLAFTPDRGLLIAATGDVGSGRGSWVPLGARPLPGYAEVRFWRLPSSRQVFRSGRIRGLSLAVSPDGRRLLTGGPRGGLSLLKLPSGNPYRELSDEPTGVPSISADGSLAAAGVGAGAGARVRVWDLDSGSLLHRIPGSAERIAISPQTDRIAVMSPEASSISLRALSTGEFLRLLKVPDMHYSHKAQLETTPDGRLLACTDGRGNVRLWDLPSGDPVTKVETAGASDQTASRRDHDRFIVTPDNRFMVTSAHTEHGGVVEMWKLSTRQRLSVLHSGPALHELRMNRTGTTLAGFGSDGSIWHCSPRILGLARTRVTRFTMAQAEALRSMPGLDPSERLWTDLIWKLVAWRHRHDIEVDDDAVPFPATTDIALDPEPKEA